MAPPSNHKDRRGWWRIYGCIGAGLVLLALIFQIYVYPVWRMQSAVAQLRSWGFQDKKGVVLPSNWLSVAVYTLTGKDWLATRVPDRLSFARSNWTVNQPLVPCDNRRFKDEDLRLLAALPPLTHLEIFDQPIGNDAIKLLPASQLWYLNLSHCEIGTGTCRPHSRITSLRFFAALQSVDQLEFLHLAQTNIADADLESLPPVNRLVFLDLSKTCVTDEALRYLGRCSKLRSLSLRETSISDAGLRYLTSVPLTSLDLHGTQISGEGLKALAGTQLEKLVLSESTVNDAGMSAVGKIGSLEHLELGDTRITDEGLSKLTGLSRLRTLNLVGCGITDNSISALLKFSELRELNVSLPQSSDDGIERLWQLKKLEMLNGVSREM